MSSTFTGLNISSAGLYATQNAMYTNNTNINNASTEGYSLQTTTTTSGTSTPVYYGNMATSSGAQVTEITRERNIYYDTVYRDQNTEYMEWYTTSKALTEIEGIFNEPSDDGLSALTSDFYASLEDLSISPDSSATRSALVESGNAVCESLNSTAEKLYTLQNDINNEIKMQVDGINNYADQIANINKEIESIEQIGGNPNALYDERDLIIDQLSEIAEVIVSNPDSGKNCRVLIDGYPLVDGSKTHDLECYSEDTMDDGSKKWDVRWEGNKNPFEATSGILSANINLRDGDGTAGTYNGIPYYINELDTFAQDLAKAFNEGMDHDGNNMGDGHADGYTLNDTTDVRFFTTNDSSSVDFMLSGADLDEVYSQVSALNISISSDVRDDSNAVSTSNTLGQEGNSDIIDSTLTILKNNHLTNNGTLSDSLVMIQTTLGIEAEFAILKESSELSMLKNAENNRLSVTSVSIDNEMAELTQQEQIYTAAAQMIQVWQEIYETTISLIGG